MAVFFVYKKEVRSGRSEKPRKSAAEARRMRRAADHTPSTLQLGTAEMARVVTPGGTVAAYVWDNANDGTPTAPIQIEMRAMGLIPLVPPRVDASRMESLRDLWAGAGLEKIETRQIVVNRTYANFEDFWATTLTMPNMGPPIAALASSDAERLKAGVRQRLPPDSASRITYRACANAIIGRVPD